MASAPGVVTEAKKRYIVEQLNPIMEECVSETIGAMPADPLAFMLKWMESRRVQSEEKLISHKEQDRLERENEQLEAQIKAYRAQMQECAKVFVVSNPDSDEESDEEDDEDDEEPPDFIQAMPQRSRQSVSAEAYGEWNAKKPFVPPVISKTDAQKDRLKQCLCRSFLFVNLEDTDFGIIIAAMKEVHVSAEQCVINQGDSGDFLFVIESGAFDCIVKTPDGGEKVVKTCSEGDVFGELALLYNCPRAATVKSKGDSVCWQLDRDTFNNIVREAAQKKRDRYDAFLNKVPLLHSMDAYERSQLADALRIEFFKEGQDVMVQGETGTKFYIIEEGAAYARKDDSVVMEYGSGDYFGELALITNKPRAATVTAKVFSKLLSVDKQTFHRLLHVNTLMERSNQYK